MNITIEEFKPIPNELKFKSLLFKPKKYIYNNTVIVNNETVEVVIKDSDITKSVIKDKPLRNIDVWNKALEDGDIISLFLMSIGFTIQGGIVLGIASPFIAIGAVGMTIGIGFYLFANSLAFSLLTIANLGGLTNISRHSKYLYNYIISNNKKLIFLDKELPKEHIKYFATPYIFYKIIKSLYEFNNLTKEEQITIVKLIRNNYIYNYSDIHYAKNRDKIIHLYKRIFYQYDPFCDSLLQCNVDNIRHSTTESLFISNYLKFLIGNHCIVE